MAVVNVRQANAIVITTYLLQSARVLAIFTKAIDSLAIVISIRLGRPLVVSTTYRTHQT